MISAHEAHRLLVRSGYEVLINSPYKYPVVYNTPFKDVAEFLHSNGYQGMFLCINELKSKKGKIADEGLNH